jgi:hypothetical protein
MILWSFADSEGDSRNTRITTRNAEKPIEDEGKLDDTFAPGVAGQQAHGGLFCVCVSKKNEKQCRNWPWFLKNP